MGCFLLDYFRGVRCRLTKNSLNKAKYLLQSKSLNFIRFQSQIKIKFYRN